MRQHCDAIYSVLQDVEQLYNGMKKLLKAKNLLLSRASRTQQQEACKDFFNQNKDIFKILTIEHIEGAVTNSIYWETHNSARDIKGGFLEQYIITNYGSLAGDKNLKTNSQDLYSLSTKLLKPE